MITWADVVLLAPELSAIAVGAQTIILTYVNAAFDTTMFKTDALKMARIYLAAHLGTVTRWQGSAIAGPVISESDGRFSRSYAVIPQNISSSFSGTSYGVMLEFLIKTSRARLPAVLA